MFKKAALTALLLQCLCYAHPQMARAEGGGRIGVVDVLRVLDTAEAAQHIDLQRKNLREKFLKEISESEQALRSEEKALNEKRGNSKNQEEYINLRREYETRMISTRKEAQGKKHMLEEASNKAMNKLRDQLYVVVQEIANERGYDLVISSKNVIAGANSLDITDETLEKLNSSIKEIPLVLGTE